MRIGADYYPEHWEKERWKTDAEMMVKANIKVIRIGEFAWSLYEPEEGKYEFDWMDEALDFFGKYGIKVVMCTPSATPPKWMIDKYPDILQNDIHGNPKLFGTRKHYCFNSQTYREKTKKLNTLIAKSMQNILQLRRGRQIMNWAGQIQPDVTVNPAKIVFVTG